MSLTRVTCAACGAGLKSSAGFTPGDSITCPRCQATFTVPARSTSRTQAVEVVEPEGSGRARVLTIVFGVIVFLGVGAMVAYAFKERQRAERAQHEAEVLAQMTRVQATREAAMRERMLQEQASNNTLDLTRVAALADRIGGPPRPATPPDAAKLHGTWRSAPTQAPVREIVYSPDGTYRDTLTDSPNPRVVSGTWKVVGGSGTRVLKIERTGGGISPIRVTFEGDELIHDGDEPGTTIVLKKG